MNKPEYLYHASENKKITVFEPRAEQVRDSSEGPVVFATPHVDSAACFIVKTDDSWTQKSAFNDVQTMIISDKSRFEGQDKGGAIYKLPSDSFINEIRGGANDEWTSRVSVMPISKKVFDSGLEAMLEYGVQVFFVDGDTFKQINTTKDHGLSILRTLVSVNQIRNINIKPLPKGDFSE